MPTQLTTRSRYSIDVQTERIEVTSLAPRPDPSWEYTDHQGHVHRWVDGEVPTLRWVEDGVELIDDGDGYFDEEPYGHDECAVCGEHIEPGLMAPPPYREFMPGYRTVTVTTPDGRQVVLTNEQADALSRAGTIESAERLLDEFTA